MLTLKNLSVSVVNKKIISKINFNFEKGKTYAIMGPNGSGKSTLAYAIMGHPSYIIDKSSKILFENRNILKLSSDKRAQLGIYLSFQSPISLSGITVFQLLRLALSGKKDPLLIKEEIEKYAKKLHIKPELIERSLNDGTSGGEKKKLEILQAAVLNPKYVIFDEIDTGVDVDSLKTIARLMNLIKKDKTYIIITHYNRILEYVKPDFVLIMIGGKLAKVGSYLLAKEIEKKGYEGII